MRSFRHGHIYTHTEGTPSYWYDTDRDADWRQVALGDALLPGIYEFVPNNNRVTLSETTLKSVDAKLIR